MEESLERTKGEAEKGWDRDLEREFAEAVAGKPYLIPSEFILTGSLEHGVPKLTHPRLKGPFINKPVNQDVVIVSYTWNDKKRCDVAFSGQELRTFGSPEHIMNLMKFKVSALCEAFNEDVRK
jgi:hypothetical protein